MCACTSTINSTPPPTAGRGTWGSSLPGCVTVTQNSTCNENDGYTVIPRPAASQAEVEAAGGYVERHTVLALRRPLVAILG